MYLELSAQQTRLYDRCYQVLSAMASSPYSDILDEDAGEQAPIALEAPGGAFSRVLVQNVGVGGLYTRDYDLEDTAALREAAKQYILPLQLRLLEETSEQELRVENVGAAVGGQGHGVAGGQLGFPVFDVVEALDLWFLYLDHPREAKETYLELSALSLSLPYMAAVEEVGLRDIFEPETVPALAETLEAYLDGEPVSYGQRRGRFNNTIIHQRLAKVKPQMLKRNRRGKFFKKPARRNRSSCG